MNSDTPHIFLSYCRDNLEQASHLHQQLTAAGLKVWWDQDGLGAGNYKVHLRKAIQDARQFVFCMSKQMPERDRNGSYPELRQAIQRLTELPPNSDFLVPVRFNECDVPDFGIDATTSLADLNWIDLFGNDWQTTQLPRLLKWLGADVLQPQQPRPKPKLHADHKRELCEQAVELRHALRACAKSGADPASIEQQLKDVRRQLRDGPRLTAGEWLSGRYELIEPIGAGGFATVWKAWDEVVHSLVAVKVLHGQFTESEERLDRFRRGANAMHKLTHPHIVRVLDPAGEDAGFHFFVMEFLPGGTLVEAVESNALNQTQKFKLLQQVGDALVFAHSQGAIHRDVTPENIILDSSHGTAKLTDFDLVRLQDSTGGTRTGAMGKFVYAAPESQESANKVDVRADVYSFAMTVMYSLHGKKLPPAQVIRNTNGFIGQLDCNDGVKRVLEHGLAFEPQDRVASIRELCVMLSAATAPPAKPKRAKAKKPKSKPKVKRTGKKSPKAEMEFVRIEAGEFQMGRPAAEEGDGDELPQHRVVITQPFLFGKYAVTQAEYEAVMGQNPSQFKDDDRRPVEKVSWFDAIEFCNRLSELDGLAPYYKRNGNNVTIAGGEGFRLPTEAEWEYACRANKPTPYNLRDSEADLNRAGWFDANAGGTTHPVGEKEPNAWELFDMHGNVWEWCWDRFESGYYKESPSEDPRGPSGGSNRVIRGGSWLNSASNCRSAYRDYDDPSDRWHSCGFRVAQGPVR